MKNSPLSHLVRTHKALAHPARLRILGMLRDGELCVCQITAVLGLAASTVSAHLKELRNAGLTSERKVGKWVNIGLGLVGERDDQLGLILLRLDDDPQIIADRQLVRQLREIPVETLCRRGFATVDGQDTAEGLERTDT